MRLYTCMFQLLDPDLWVFTTEDGRHSVLANKDLVGLLDYFFEMDDQSFDSMHEFFWRNVHSMLKLTIDDMLYFCDNLVATEVAYFDILDWVVYDGFYLVHLNVNLSHDPGSFRYLGVSSVEDSHFVGALSSHTGNSSSPELSKLIISVPEIQWSL